MKLWTGKDAFTPIDLRFGEKGDRLFAIMNTASGAQAIAYDMNKLTSLKGVQTNWHNGNISFSSAFPASARVAVSSARSAYVAVNPIDGTGSEFAAGHASWIGRFAPTSLSFGTSPIPASAFAFDATGNILWSNSTTANETTKLYPWTCSNGTFTRGASPLESGLGSAVQALGVYTIDGTEYVVAAAQGKVTFVNAASGALKFTVSDATNLGASVKAVRMSHCDYFRPRLYVLLETGDVACYYLNRELTKFTWSKTNSNTKLLTVTGAPFGSDAAKVVAFDVTADGGTAAVGYAQNSGDESQPTGPTYLAIVRNASAQWTYYAAGDADNPSTGGVSCMSDGTWILHASIVDASAKTMMVGTISSEANRGNGYLNGIAAEYLDFSSGIVKVGNDSYSLTQMAQWSLGVIGDNVSATTPGRGPRVFLQSVKFANAGQWMKGLGYSKGEATGSFEEMIMDSTSLNWIGSWTNFGTNNEHIVLHYPKLATADRYSINPNSQIPYGLESDFEDCDFSVLTTIHEGAFGRFYAKGALELPSAVVISNAAFGNCPFMTEVRISETKKSLKRLYDSAFSSNGQLKRVVMGCADGCVINANNVFSGQPLEEVVFTGAIPTYKSGITVAWPDAAANQMTFAVPRGDAAWEAIIADSTKVKTKLTLAEQRAYWHANPDKYVPIGIVDKSVFLTKYDQYIAYNDMKGGVSLTIERDTFFDDEIEITSDLAAAADGTYFPGTTVTLKAKPNATGTFVKWYGDVDRAVETNATITLTFSEDSWLYCRIVHPWTLSTASSPWTLANGNFTLNCRKYNESAKLLWVGNGEKFGLYNAAADVGVGVVDLGGPIIREGTDEKWTISDLQSPSGGMVGMRSGRGSGATTLILPGTLTDMNVAQWLHCNLNKTMDGVSYKTLIVDEPLPTQCPFPAWSTSGQSELSHLILRTPKATNIFSVKDEPHFWEITGLSASKFDWWDLTSITSISPLAFNYAWTTVSSRIKARGKLSLPSYCNVTNSLHNLTNVREISLGGLTKKTTVRRLYKSMYGNTSLKKVTIHNDKDLEVPQPGVFSTDGIPEEIVLTGVPTATDVFANLLNVVTAAATKPVKIYVSRAMGWNSGLSYVDEATDAECAEAPGEVVLGVYRGGAASPNGKALFVHRDSPYDPAGMTILIR